MTSMMLTFEQRNYAGLGKDPRSVKLQGLCRRMSKKPVDIIIASETYWTDEHAQKQNIPGYFCYHRQREGTGQMRGGVAIFVNTKRKDISHELVQKTGPGAPIEAITIKISMNKDPNDDVFITSAYAPPNDRNEETPVRQEPLNEMRPPQVGHGSKWIVAGDFNAHHPLWDPRARPNIAGEEFLVWTAEHGLQCYNDPNQPTRVETSSRGVKSSPDITTARNLALQNWKVIPNRESDHEIIRYACIPGTPAVRPKRRFYSYVNVDWEQFAQDIEDEVTPTTTYAKFVRAIEKSRGKHIKKVSHPDYTPIWTEEMKNAKEAWNAAEKEFAEALSSEADEETRKNLHSLRMENRGKYEETLRVARKEAIEKRQEEFAKGDATVWRFIRNCGGKPQQATGATLYHNGKRLTTEKDKAKAFIEKFSTVSKRQPGSRKPNKVRVKKDYRPVTQAEFDTALNDLKDGKAPGPDEITAEMLKHLGPKARLRLRELISTTLQLGTIPKQWRIGEIVPLWKTSKPAKAVDSYRPVTLTSHISKLAERVIARRIMFQIHDKLHPMQYGFRKGRSTVDAICNLLERVTEAFESTEKHRNSTGEKWIALKQRAISICVDFTSAFDTIDHEEAINGLVRLGVGSHELRWVRNFLSGRQGRVRYNDTTSKWKKFESGVPQGTVLGPLLFIVAMDSLLVELAKEPGIHQVAFADDLTITTSGVLLKEMILTLQKGMDIVRQWTTRSKMRVNIGKTQGIYFSLDRDKDDPDEFTRDPLYYKDEQGVDRVILIQKRAADGSPHPKLLGCRTDRQANFNDHSDEARAKGSAARAQVAYIASPHVGATRDTMKCFMDAYAMKKMDYAAEIFYSLLGDDRRSRFDSAHRAMLRIALGAAPNADSIGVLIEAGEIPLELEMRRRNAVLVERLQRLDKQQRQMAKAELHPTKCKLKVKSERREREHPLKPGVDLIKEAYRWSNVSATQTRLPVVTYGEIPPWETGGAEKVQIYEKLSETKKSELSVEEQLDISQRAIRSRGDFWAELWCDGAGCSFIAQRHGGAGYTIYVDGVCTTEGKVPAGAAACPHTAEGVGLEAALVDFLLLVRDKGCTGRRLLIATDSKSLLDALKKGPLKQDDPRNHSIWKILLQLAALGIEVVLQHVFAHCGLVKNEKVDELAKEAGKLPQKGVPLAFRDSKRLINRYVAHLWQKKLADKAYTNESYRVTHFGTDPPPAVEASMRRGDQVIMTRFRTGLHPKLGVMPRQLRKTMPLSCRFCCPEEHREEKSVQKQTASSEKTPCPLCNTVLSTKPNARKHLETMHGKTHDQTFELIPGVQYKCPVISCGMVFRIKKEQIAHTKSSHAFNAKQDAVQRKSSAGPEETMEHLTLICPALHELRSQHLSLSHDSTPKVKMRVLAPSKVVAFIKALVSLLENKGQDS